GSRVSRQPRCRDDPRADHHRRRRVLAAGLSASTPPSPQPSPRGRGLTRELTPAGDGAGALLLFAFLGLDAVLPPGHLLAFVHQAPDCTKYTLADMSIATRASA